MATLKQLMTILSMNKVSDDERAQLVYSWSDGRTTSATGLSQNELDTIVKMLQTNDANKPDVWRKRLLAAVYGFLKKMNKVASPEIVEGIICRAAKVEDFNKIPVFKLISLYNMFSRMQKDLIFGKRMVDSFIRESQCYN